MDIVHHLSEAAASAEKATSMDLQGDSLFAAQFYENAVSHLDHVLAASGAYHFYTNVHKFQWNFSQVVKFCRKTASQYRKGDHSTVRERPL
mmetsp:Transcript_51533/g.134627  ORF Transcript_51533/g.134627 Transcript_51533/m.134627 type:complete len:91 (+) Transcript_51533:38-310(+)